MEKRKKRRSMTCFVIIAGIIILAILIMKKIWNLLTQKVKEREQQIIEKRKKRRSMPGFIIIAVVIILVVSNFTWYKIDELKKVKFQFQNIIDNLSSIQKNLEDAKSETIEDFYFTDNLIEQYTQNLELAKIKLSDVENLLSKLENCEKSEMRAIYETAKAKTDEVKKLLLEVDVDYMLLTIDNSISNVNDTCDREEAELVAVQKALENWDYDKLDISEAYNRYNEMRAFITSIRESTQKMISDMQPKIDNVCTQRASIQTEACESKLHDFQGIIEEYEHIEEVKLALLQKINSLAISQNLDMSKPVGFTEEELRYLLESIGIVRQRNPEIIDVLPRVMVEAVKDYPVNELFSIAVMSFETGYFRSPLATRNFNYGGMMGANGKGLKFDNMEEGLIAAIKCLHKNLKGNNTIFEVNQSYCTPTDLNGDGKIEGNEELYRWSYQVMSIMKSYKNAILKELS